MSISSQGLGQVKHQLSVCGRRTQLKRALCERRNVQRSKRVSIVGSVQPRNGTGGRDTRRAQLLFEPLGNINTFGPRSAQAHIALHADHLTGQADNQLESGPRSTRLSQWHAVSRHPTFKMGLAFGTYNEACDSVAMVVCPMLGSSMGLEPICYSRNVEINSTVIFQPGESCRRRFV